MRGIHRLADVAARQHGAFSRLQAVECGFSYSSIQAHTSAGNWLALENGVYAFRSSPPTWERRLQAALLSRPVALAAGRSAAHLHDFDGFPRSRPEILVPFEGNPRSNIARVIRSRHFDQIAASHARGFPVTTAAETILTLSYREPSDVVARLVDDQLAARRLVIEDFDPILERLQRARMRGLASLRGIVAARDKDGYQPPTSRLESLLYSLLDEPGVPPYERQSPLHLLAERGRVDAYIPAWRLIVEADGRRWHTRQQDFEKDRNRDNAAAALGLAVLRFTYLMLTTDRDGCLETLAQTGSWRRTA